MPKLKHKTEDWSTLINLKALIHKTSRRFQESKPEFLHKVATDQFAALEGRVYLLLFGFSPFFGGPRDLGEN